MAGEASARALGLATVLLRWRRARRIAVATTLGYLLLYLYAIGDLSLQAAFASPELRLAQEPWALVLAQRSPLYFEAVAMLQLGWMTLLLAPMNLLIGALLAVLVAANIVLAYLALSRPRVCRGRPATGVLAAVPALLAGSACCGPAVLLALGVQASAFLVGLFSWLVPLAAALLVGTLLFNAARVDLGALRAGAERS